MLFEFFSKLIKPEIKDREPLIRSVDSLKGIYAIMVALAITNSINTLFKGNPESIIDESILIHIPILTAFFFTIVPFFHGMNRHLDVSYLTKTTKTQGFLLFDFFIFCLESITLVIFSIRYTNELEGFYILAVLLVVDVIWGILASIIHYRKVKIGTINWVAINVITIFIGFLILRFISPLSQKYFLCLLAIFRTIFDYKVNWQFYFPKVDESPN